MKEKMEFPGAIKKNNMKLPEVLVFGIDILKACNKTLQNSLG